MSNDVILLSKDEKIDNKLLEKDVEEIQEPTEEIKEEAEQQEPESSVQVTYKGQEVTINFKDITFGEKQDIMKKATEIKIKKGKIRGQTEEEVSFDTYAYNMLVVYYSIGSIDPPVMPKTLEAIKELSGKEGTKLMNKAMAFNSLNL